MPMTVTIKSNDWQPRETVSQAAREKVRAESRRFIDSLATRFGELDKLAQKAKTFHVFSPEQLAEFRYLFGNFRELSEEFLMLSQLTEESLDKFQKDEVADTEEHRKLDEYFVRLQVPMLHRVISTNLRLLKVWDDCVQCGEDLPYGAYELFRETLRIIYHARAELLRPCYAELLDEAALRDVNRVERLLNTLMQRAPKLVEFIAKGALPDQRSDQREEPR
jgi:hypothetical protein